jgi:alkylation response protein AidB-like acyl-CoA dehydrogenase
MPATSQDLAAVDFTVSKEDAAFRAEVRAWLAANVPHDERPGITLSGHEQAQYMRAWQRKLFDGGWAGISWPTAYGGRGLSLVQQVIWYEEYARANAPEVSCLFVGLNHGGPTLITCGTDAQKARHLPRILRGDDIWCQGFSEPGAGSDLAGLRTRADIDGDHLVVNGQKIWTSFAQVADYQELLVRTDPTSSRQKGITWIICDMKTPGVTVRPIPSIDGEHHNCEVFYDNVRIPISNVVGEINDGWRVAMATLSFERGTAFMELQLRSAVTIAKLIRLAAETRGPGGRPVLEDSAFRMRVGKLRGHCAALRAMTYMGASRAVQQSVPGPEGTYIALMLAEIKQATTQLAMDVLGPRGLERPAHLATEDWVHQYLYNFSASMGGGTTEIRRNIIAERILGLPRHK